MQPISLKLEHFGPYKNSLIDFSAYYAQSLFLITGKTGSGKTTIFDGMSYALYGSTSGGLRQGKEMRSNFAHLGQKTKVTFMFKQQGKTYQVEREPEQIVKKQRGDGEREQPASVKLTIFDENKKEINQLTKQKEVGPFLSELLQLNEQQFSQIVMLPQGEFRRFLISDSDSKEKVLRKLFDTYYYQQVAEILRKKKKEQELDRKESQQELRLLVAQIEWNDTFHDIDCSDRPVTEIINVYNEQEEQEKREEKDSKQALKQKKEQHEKILEKIQLAKKLIEQFEEQKQSIKQLESLEQRQPVIDQDKEQVMFLKKVQKIEPTFERLKELIDEQNVIEKKITELSGKRANSIETQKDISENLCQLEKQKQDISEKETQLSQIERSIPLFERKESVEKDLKQQESSLSDMKVQRNKLVETQTTIEKELALISQLISSKPEHLEEKHILERKIEEADNQLKEVSSYLDKLDLLSESKKMLADLVSKLIEADKLLVEQQVAHKQLKSDWAKAQIAKLSLDLIEGQACLICGSTNHPNPFHGEEMTKEDMCRLESEFEGAEIALSAAKELCVTLQHEKQYRLETVDRLQVDVTETEKELTLLMELNSSKEEWLDTIKQKQSEFSTRLLQKRELLNDIDNQKEKEIKLKMELTDVTGQVTAQEVSQRESEAKRIQLATSYESLLEQLPTHWKSLDEMLEKKDRLNLVVTDWKESLSTCNKKQQETEKELLVINTTLLNESEKAEEITKKITRENTKLEEFMRQENILAHELADRIKELNKIDLLEETIRLFENSKFALSQEVDKRKSLLENQEQPDINLLLEDESHLNKEIDEHQELLRLLQNRMDNNQKKLEKIKLKASDISESLASLEEMTELSDVMIGDSVNKLSVERFVLQTYLKQVLNRANEKLLILTNGRYQFELKEESGSYKKKTGLEINIFDDNAGSVRSVTTLSGGESFIAALSLALSLAEVIQEESGGIKIDAMFIDEGFGSLDEDALEMAIRALESIEGEGRIIGIISHVRELKERIPQQLQVISENGKSRVIERLEFE